MEQDSTQREPVSCLVVGAGIAGLMAARELQRQGVSVTVLDKGRGVGGRMATRRFAGGVFDHGTQYFAPSSPWFQARITEWVHDGIAREWFRVRAYELDPRFISAARFCGCPTMTAVPKQIADGIEVHTSERVTRIERADSSWRIGTEAGSSYHARSCILTPPVPQTLALIEDSDCKLAAVDRAVLRELEYEPCHAVLAVCDGVPTLPENGVLEFERGNLRRIMDNTRKGVSPDVQAVTIHAMGDFSAAHIDDDPEDVARMMIEEAQPIIEVPVRDFQVHRWRYSQIVEPHGQPCLLLQEDPPLAVAGDAFGANGVEGAARSGMEAARRIMRSLAN